MRNFLRAVKASWPYRARLVFSLLMALLAAACWSLNFLTIHPCMKILSGVHSLPESVDADIAQIQTQLEPHQRKLADYQEQLANVEHWPEGAVKDAKKSELSGLFAHMQWKINQESLSIYRLQLLRSIYVRFLPADRFAALCRLLLLVVAVIALNGFFDFAQESLVGSVTNLTLYNLRNRFYRQVLRLDETHFGEAGTHGLMARFTNDMEALGAGLKTLYGKVIAEPLRAFGCILLACTVSWRLTLLFLILVPLGGFFMAKVGQMMKRASRRLLERMSDIYKILQESFQGIRVVKAFTMEPYERLRFRTATREYYRKAMKVVNIEAGTGPVIELMGVIGVVLALLAGSYLVLSGKTEILGVRMTSYPLDYETLLMYYALLASIADPARKLSSVYTKLQSGAAAADRIFAIMDLQPRVRTTSQGAWLASHAKEIEFRDICFSYEPNRPILTSINLSVKHGQVVAFVGRNGSGKSTLLGLLPRFNDPDHGSILIDGVDIRSVLLRSLRKQMAIVTQDTILFDDTIFANIAYGKRHASREQVEFAARKAFAHEFIETLPKGYDTRIGELGRALSGGEKQRIALARAILRDPKIMILDECTSQVDAESEVKIHQALQQFTRGRTTFLITHRLNTLEVADSIVVLERGRIEAVGMHAELLRTSRVYQSLHEANHLKKAA